MSSLDEIVQKHDDAIYDLQQRMFSSSGPATNRFKVIIIDDGTGEVILDLATDAITGLTLTPGADFSDIYVDVHWNMGPLGTLYTIEYAEKTGPGAYTVVDSIGGLRTNNYRIHHLKPQTTYGFRVFAVGASSVPSNTPAWTDVLTTKDSTIPTLLTGVVVGRGATSVIVKFNPSADADVAGGKGLYLVQISNDNFATIYAQTFTTAYVVPFSDVTAEGTFKARVAAIDESGNQGPFATSAAYTAGGVIDAMLVGAFSAGHITFGSMDGDRINANSLDVVTIKSSSMTSATVTINGGALRVLGGTGGVGLLLNSQGLSLYNTSGVRQVFLDASNGNASFAGSLSAATGTFAGSLTAATGTFAGSLTAATGTFAGSLSAATGTFAGTVTAGTVQVGLVDALYQGVSLDSSYNNIFFKHPSGIIYFRINAGGANSLTYASDTGALQVTGQIYATSGTLGTLTVTGTLTGGTLSGNAITGAMITGTTFQGGTFRTAAAGADRLEISSTFVDRIRFVNAAGSIRGQIWSLFGSNSVTMQTGVSALGQQATITVAAYDNISGSRFFVDAEKADFAATLIAGDRGTGGPGAPRIATRDGAHHITFSWTGGTLYFHIDDVAVKLL